ncbi:MAG: hypothetical protein Q9172_004750 [Xanthocarpia lactea]
MGVGVRPTCFPSRPYCPEHPVIYGREDAIKDMPRAYGLPRKWGAMPDNCVVKIDVNDPQATEEATMKMLAASAELVVRRCIQEGTGCGGTILTGRTKALELTLGYYTAVDLGESFTRTRPNVSYNIYADA